MNWMIRILLFLLFFSALLPQAKAQYDFNDDLYYDHPFTYELGGSLGLMNCFTDLGGNKGAGKAYVKDFRTANAQFTGSVYFTTMYKYALGLRAEASFGSIRAGDNELENVKSTTFGRFERNLSFKSTIIEIMLVSEVHPLFFKQYPYGKNLPRISPYLVGGIGYFSFNPKAKLNGTWVALHPLHTEGQGFAEYPDRKPYKLKQLNFPLGIGLKYKLTPMCNLSVEALSRVLTTDYLDDVSTAYIDQDLFARYLSGIQLDQAILLNDRQKELNPAHVTKPGYERGNPSKNDAYYTLNFKISLVF